MRLIVGPLPAAVYWRRRAVVLVGLAMIVMVVSYACGGPGIVAGAGSSPSKSVVTTPSVIVHRPTVLPTSASPTPKQSAFVLPTTAVTGPCTDGELDLTATAAAPYADLGKPIDFTIQIKNISGRTCSRDIGADMQELRLQDGDILVWSSDDCNANSGHDMRSFAPGKKVSFTLTWSGKRSRTGTGAVNCAGSPAAPVTYKLISRLDQKYSSPFALTLRSS